MMRVGTVTDVKHPDIGALKIKCGGSLTTYTMYVNINTNMVYVFKEREDKCRAINIRRKRYRKYWMSR